MRSKPHPRRALQDDVNGRRGTSSAAATAVALLVVGMVALVVGIRGSDGPPQPAAQVEVSAVSTPTPQRTSPAASTAMPKSAATPARPVPKSTSAATDPRQPQVGVFLPASRPTVLDIPSIGLRSTNFVDLHVAQDGRLNVPGSANEVGFYADGPTPGQIGPAVLAAHVDSVKGPGVFYRLGAVKPGAKVQIARQDRSRLTFVVDKVAVYPKDKFPNEEVYNGGYRNSEIRLVTCGGPFDRVKHYLDNTVVFGHLTNAR